MRNICCIVRCYMATAFLSLFGWSFASFPRVDHDCNRSIMAYLFTALHFRIPTSLSRRRIACVERGILQIDFNSFNGSWVSVNAVRTRHQSAVAEGLPDRGRFSEDWRWSWRWRKQDIVCRGIRNSLLNSVRFSWWLRTTISPFRNSVNSFPWGARGMRVFVCLRVIAEDFCHRTLCKYPPHNYLSMNIRRNAWRHHKHRNNHELKMKTPYGIEDSSAVILKNFASYIGTT